jgi:hypothetical protein
VRRADIVSGAGRLPAVVLAQKIGLTGSVRSQRMTTDPQSAVASVRPSGAKASALTTSWCPVR